MKTPILHTTGNNRFEESTFELPDITPNEIQVKSIMTGICRSDIDMMQGHFGPLPLQMQGHEGLARVIKIGDNITDVKVDDIVATRGEPAYADFYNVRQYEYVKVPYPDPKYILEPVACGINVILQAEDLIKQKTNRKTLILGSGFLAWVAYHTLKINQLTDDITVVGHNNKTIWQSTLQDSPTSTYDIIVDLSSSATVFDQPILNNETLVIFGSQKLITTDFSNLLWHACTMVFPSPRTEKFYKCMQLAESYITNDLITVDQFWTKGYNRTTQWQQAFTDGVTRPPNYSRGYIIWPE